MIDLRKDYDDIKKHRKALVDELKELEKDEKVKKYIELEKQEKKCHEIQTKLYKNMKFEEYSECKHLLVYSRIDQDRREGRTYKFCGCIKCGLTDEVLDEALLEEDIKSLPYKEKVMHDYLTENHIWYLPGKQLHISCDLSLARGIYSKIMEANPDIDEKTAICYFDKALHNIRNTKVSEARKKSRAKRLSLNHKFDSWNSDDIYN